MKKLLTVLFVLFVATTMRAQGVKPLPSLHVEGKWLVDTHGNHVVLHGVMDTPSAWFNGGRWGWSYDDAGRRRCLDYFEKLFTGFEKAKCTVFRLHLEPAWTNDGTSGYSYYGAANQPAGMSGEADISKFNPTRLKTYMNSLYFPLMQKAMKHGMYVVVRPPGVCPRDLKVSDYYQQYLMEVWDIVTQNDSIRKYAGQISIELANEPVNIKNSMNADDTKALHDYFQPLVEKIRANGFTGIVWIPGTGYQSNYRNYKNYPITGYNIGYAVHDYPGWYNSSDDNPDPTNKRNNFHNAVPVVDTNPVIITEVDWSPLKEPLEFDHNNEWGQPVYKNLGTWATASTSKWGKAFKAMIDYFGNISMTLTHPHDFLDIDTLLEKNGKVVAAFDANPEACGKACMDWYAEYYEKDYAKADFTSVPVSAYGKQQYINPIVRADFPDPDVIRVGDTYYMVSTTMHHFPGATILKSQDMVNWEYCAHPLQQLGTDAGFKLLNNKDAYGSGMWACSMKYHNGKFHILINEKRPVDGWNLNGYLLTATNPEGKWEMKKLSRSYYDPGMLFDNGKVYVAQGIGNISVCELDENFNFKKEVQVLSNKEGLEGCHFYKRGDYYYIYATYGGWPSGQALFRSKDVFGPYEEKMVVEKSYNNVANTIHQGALIEDVAGKWWTIMQEDLGALGRMPNLQPVTWTSDGWIKVGNSSGAPYQSFTSKITKPKSTGDNSIKHLPTTDVFRTFPLAPQWEWNHYPDNNGWSLMERAGWLRLKTTTVAATLPQVRNMLTQRIFAIQNKYTNGTIRLDASQLKEGDRAGICILQDPFGMIAAEKKNGKLQLVWQQDKVRDAGDSFQPAEKTQAVELENGIVYLRAAIKYGENKAKFFYSTDNKTWKQLGGETSMTFNLTVFVGARFGLFCQATQEVGGIADFDWFTTEDSFDEADLYPATFTAPVENMFKTTKIEVPTPTYFDTMVGEKCLPVINATFADKHVENVYREATYVPAEEGIVEFYQGQMLGVGQGSTKVNVSYSDLLGNSFEKSFTARSSYFPLDYAYVRGDIAGSGSFKKNTTNGTFKFSTTDSQMGWVYKQDVDLSEYRYLVIKLTQKQTANAKLNIYTSNSLKGNCYSSPVFGNDLQIVIDLEKATYTAGTNKGKALDRKKVRMVTFSGSVIDKTLSVKEMFLTNDKSVDPDGIEELTLTQEEAQHINVYTIGGQLVRSSVERSKATQGLTPGIYVVGQRKVVVR